MAQFIDALPRAGLALSDIDARFYRSGVSAPAELGALALESIAGADYLLTGPDPLGVPCAITREVDGSAGAFEYGFAGTAPYVILPVRESGHDATSLALRLYRNGTPYTVDVWSVVEIGSPGDYRVSGGWPITADGASWVLLWDFAGATYARVWTASAAVVLPPGDALLDFVALQEQTTATIAAACGGRLSTLRRYVRVLENRVQVSVSPIDYRVYAIAGKVHQVPVDGQLVTAQQIVVSALGVPDDVPTRPTPDWSFIDPLGAESALARIDPVRPDFVTTVVYQFEVAR